MCRRNPAMHLSVSQRRTGWRIRMSAANRNDFKLNGTIPPKLTTVPRFHSPASSQWRAWFTLPEKQIASLRRGSGGCGAVVHAAQTAAPGLISLRTSSQAFMATTTARPERETGHSWPCAGAAKGESGRQSRDRASTRLPFKRPRASVSGRTPRCLLLLSSRGVYLGLRRFETQTSCRIRTSEALAARFECRITRPRPGISLGKFPA